jgi:hypothetical protein
MDTAGRPHFGMSWVLPIPDPGPPFRIQNKGGIQFRRLICMAQPCLYSRCQSRKPYALSVDGILLDV